MFNLNYNFMAKFSDKELLSILLIRIGQLYHCIPPEPTGSPDVDSFDSGRRWVLDALSFAYSSAKDFEFD